ncbi:hypothetical protein [Francisella marina]|uniref:50S ribosomal protein L29 n=1 Tax=Francisella marina TaxID=2249302 RepID=A0ABX5ZHE4_9GAMM|nr:hypothetical protein [Francisella marina]QEO57587.1 hypothetical protein F0R74_06865 [Francisella marina]
MNLEDLIKEASTLVGNESIVAKRIGETRQNLRYHKIYNSNNLNKKVVKDLVRRLKSLIRREKSKLEKGVK